ncbi:hypothetical protein D3C80_1740010 [compost metagenome]
MTQIHSLITVVDADMNMLAEHAGQFGKIAKAAGQQFVAFGVGNDLLTPVVAQMAASTADVAINALRSGAYLPGQFVQLGQQFAKIGMHRAV